MVVLSASILSNRGSKPLVSRQFVEMNRLRVEGLLAAFPKLMGHSKQHTFVETDAVRYVYQPMENGMYLLLITTKASNIVEDLGTLRLLAKVVPDVTGSVTEHSINEHAFEIIFAFDEVLTTGGYKEDISPSTIRTNLEMHSHEEEMALMLKKSKEDAAKEQMQAQAKAIKDRQMAALRDNLMRQYQSDNPYAHLGKSSVPEPDAPKVVAKGMKLGGVGGSKKKDSLMAAMASEDNLMGGFGGGAGGSAADPFGLGLGGPAAASAALPAAPSAPATIVVEEKMTVQMTREGGIESSEVKGTITYTANTEAGSMANVAVNKAIYSAKCGNGWSFATHPKVEKKDYEQNGILSLKGGKGFPLNRPVGILRWNYSGEDSAPFTVNCWPEDAGSGTITVNMEFELQRMDAVITDVNILLPLGTTDPPAIESIDGQFKHDPNTGMMCWHQDVIDANNSSGSLEFSIAGSDEDVFFPVQIAFSSQSLMCPIEITSLTNAQSGAPIPNNMTVRVVPESYQCV
ncbi:coatomer protein subunit delta [Thalassiosira pseudonana CCMP1335]|uniref:Coatomer subunit delta n=1 Tax=Thalassiosira pseudonana TaxID=35128 RepID=B8BV63_THAPS|nr:coatomer protein subunit delta [Thalassiosira pseudonana CCMP1335]EED94881.1 coatomer protein subunit delta [Thalassiosira pseudonana CCMP1335]